MLEDLGTRICILGPSNSGKSTLANAIGAALGLETVHLDQLFHRPHTDWDPRPEHEFLALHDQAIKSERWVIDGNYTRCMPQRLARSTGVVLLDVNTVSSLLRYVRRTLFETKGRAGALAGERDTLKWAMVRHITVATRANRKRYASDFERITLPKVALLSRRAIANFYEAEGLRRIGAGCGDRDARLEK